MMTGIHDPRHLQATFTLPHDIDVEMTAIGQVLIVPKAWQDFCHLQPEDFFDPLHQTIWRAIRRLNQHNKRVDAATVITEACDGIGEDRRDHEVRTHLGACMGYVVAVTTTAHNANVLRELAERRRIIEGCMEYAHKASTTGYTVQAADIAGEAIADLQSRASGQRDLVDTSALLDSIEADLDRPMRVTATGFPRLDYALRGGFHASRFYGLGASMKAGKSTWMGSISYNMATRKNPDPHVYLCLEMRAEEIFQRYLARRMSETTGAEINTDIFFDRNETDQKWFRECLQEARETFRNSGLKFLAKPRMSLDALKSTLARIALSGEYKGVFVDYMQLVSGKHGNGNQTEHLDNVCQTIAEITAAYPIWVCAAAQLNQEGGVRGGKGMEAAADMVLALHKIEFDGVEGAEPYYKAHLEMQASRYTPILHIGTEEEPAYDFLVTAGPSYKELPVPRNVPKFAAGMKGMK